MHQACPGWQEPVQISEKTTGLSPAKSAHGDLSEATGGRPLSQAWISDDLLARTREVWAKAYGRPVTEDEAVEMLMNVKRAAETLMRAMGLAGGA